MLRTFLLLLTVLLGPTAIAQSSHAELFVKTIGEFSIFPAEQTNNAVYRQGKLLVKRPSVRWLDLHKVRDSESWLVSGMDDNGKYYSHLILKDKDKIEMSNQGYGVFEIFNKEKGIREIYRMYQGKLETVKSKYKSIRSPTSSATHLVFAHIRDSRKERKKQIFEFRLHLIRHDSKKVKSLKLYPRNESAKLNMVWVDKTKIQIRHHNGKTETFDLQKYAPALFD
jgi:hypothetical protein